jgi:hypothetical protein
LDYANFIQVWSTYIAWWSLPLPSEHSRSFLQTFAKSLHEHGLKLSVDIATWSAIWNYAAIADTEADMIISMVLVPPWRILRDSRMNYYWTKCDAMIGHIHFQRY